MAKARSVGTAFGCVRDSNHFGIAGFYAMMPLSEDMIGVAMTNTAARGTDFRSHADAWHKPSSLCGTGGRGGCLCARYVDHGGHPGQSRGI